MGEGGDERTRFRLDRGESASPRSLNAKGWGLGRRRGGCARGKDGGGKEEKEERISASVYAQIRASDRSPVVVHAVQLPGGECRGTLFYINSRDSGRACSAIGEWRSRRRGG